MMKSARSEARAAKGRLPDDAAIDGKRGRRRRGSRLREERETDRRSDGDCRLKYRVRSNVANDSKPARQRTGEGIMRDVWALT